MTNGNLRTMIREAVRREIAAALREEIGATMTDDNRRDDSAFPLDDNEPVENATGNAPNKRRRRSRRYGPRVGYTMSKRGPKNPDLFPTAEKVYKAIKGWRKDSPITAPDIEKLTGLGRKTVESCVWYLRNTGLVESTLL